MVISNACRFERGEGPERKTKKSGQRRNKEKAKKGGGDQETFQEYEKSSEPHTKTKQVCLKNLSMKC